MPNKRDARRQGRQAHDDGQWQPRRPGGVGELETAESAISIPADRVTSRKSRKAQHFGNFGECVDGLTERQNSACRLVLSGSAPRKQQANVADRSKPGRRQHEFGEGFGSSGSADPGDRGRPSLASRRDRTGSFDVAAIVSRLARWPTHRAAIGFMPRPAPRAVRTARIPARETLHGASAARRREAEEGPCRQGSRTVAGRFPCDLPEQDAVHRFSRDRPKRRFRCTRRRPARRNLRAASSMGCAGPHSARPWRRVGGARESGATGRTNPSIAAHDSGCLFCRQRRRGHHGVTPDEGRNASIRAIQEGVRGKVRISADGQSVAPGLRLAAVPQDCLG